MAIVFSFATSILLGRRLWQGRGVADLFRMPLSTLGLGVLGLFGSNCLYVVALSLGGEPVPVNIAALSWPVFMVVLVACAGVARATWLDAAAMAVGFGGVILLSLQRGPASIDWPILVSMLGAFCWAAYSGLRTRVPPGPSDAMILFVGVSCVLCWGITLTTEPGSAPWNIPWDEFLRLAAVGIIPVGLANLAWDHGARHGDPVLLAGLSFLEPIASTGLIALFLGKPVGFWDAMALALVLVAVFFSVLSERQRRAYLRRQASA